MATIVERASDAAARLLLRSATVTAVTEHGDFRTIELAGDSLADVEWVPGDKIRIRAGALALRTYTPLAWDRATGSTRILAHLHGHGPGSEWCRAARVGTRCHLRGPDRSVRLDQLSAPAVFVGDETSLGLLVALRDAGPGAPVATLLEVTDADAVRSALSAYGIDDDELCERGPVVAAGGGFVERVLHAAHAHRDAPVVLTGRAQTIASVRRALKSAGRGGGSTLVKAYWDENRKGLD